MKKILLQLVFAFVVLPLSLCGTVYHLDESGFFNIDQIEVIVERPAEGQRNFVEPLATELESRLAAYRGISLWNIQLKEVSRALTKMEWVESSAIKRSWPSSLTVRVKPHEVKLLYVGKNGKLLPIIKDGKFLTAVESTHAPDVALLEGEVFAKKSELRKRAVDLMDEVPELGAFSKKTISEIRYDHKDGFWMTLIHSGIQVKMGEEQVALKSTRVSKVVEYLDSNQFEARVIDANLSKKVLVRLRKGP